MSQQTPLVLAAVPSRFQTSSIVKLKAGSYSIISDTVDSKLALVIGRETNSLHLNKNEFEFSDAVDVYVELKQAGTEKYFSVFAKRV